MRIGKKCHLLHLYDLSSERDLNASWGHTVHSFPVSLAVAEDPHCDDRLPVIQIQLLRQCVPLFFYDGNK